MSHDGDAKKLHERLNVLRAARGFAPDHAPEALDSEAAATAKAVQDHKSTPDKAVDDLLHHSRARLQTSVRGWAFETTSLDRMSFPEELLGTNAPSLGIGVGHYKVEGLAWGRFIIFLVEDSGTQRKTARRETPSDG